TNPLDSQQKRRSFKLFLRIMMPGRHGSFVSSNEKDQISAAGRIRLPFLAWLPSVTPAFRLAPDRPLLGAQMGLASCSLCLQPAAHQCVLESPVVLLSAAGFSQGISSASFVPPSQSDHRRMDRSTFPVDPVLSVQPAAPFGCSSGCKR